RGQRVRGAAFKTVDDAGDFLRFQRARLRNIGELPTDKGLALGTDRRRSDRRAAVRLQRGVRDAPDVPDLDEDAPAALVHALGDLAPARDLFVRVNAGRVLITLALLRDLACLGDQ